MHPFRRSRIHISTLTDASMTVGLFIPCYIDQFFPQVGIATVRLLERHGVHVEYPTNQTCCGQPMANAGFEDEALGAMSLFVRNFAAYEYVVAPSGSCVHHVRHHYDRLTPDSARSDISAGDIQHVKSQTYELCEFLTDVLGIERIDGSFPYRVGLHESCHGLRGLGLGTPSEVRLPAQNKVRRLLEGIRGLELVDLDRRDECCGFGGTFAVQEEAVSVRMGNDRIQDHVRHDAEVITGTDISCLMHLDGLIRRQGVPVRTLHVAEILNGAE